MYMFPSASSATSVGPHKPADLAGPPSPSCSPPSPDTVSMVAGFSAPSLALLPPPQALRAKTTSATSSSTLKACLTAVRYIRCSSSISQNSSSKAPGTRATEDSWGQGMLKPMVGYLTLQPFGFGSKSTNPSAGVFVGAMNVTYRTALALPRLRTTCTSPLVSKKPSPALTTLLWQFLSYSVTAPELTETRATPG